MVVGECRVIALNLNPRSAVARGYRRCWTGRDGYRHCRLCVPKTQSGVDFGFGRLNCLFPRQNSLLFSLLAGKTGGAGRLLHCVASQPVRALEIFALMSREGPLLAGILRRVTCLWIPNLMVAAPGALNISTRRRHYSRFRENWAGDLVRSDWATGLPVRPMSIFRAIAGDGG